MQSDDFFNRRTLFYGLGTFIASGLIAPGWAAETGSAGSAPARPMQSLLGSDLSKPLGVLNLLRFKERATYENASGPAISGAEAYALYGKGVRPLLKRIGAHVVFAAPKGSIRPAGEWDKVFVMRYPTRHVFLDMLASEEYRLQARHRTAAVADARGIPMDLTDDAFDWSA
jgi:uncharacterized protein (DUF1330 family)